MGFLDLFRRNRTRAMDLRLPFEVAKAKTHILVIDDDEHAFPLELFRDEGYIISHWNRVRCLRDLEQDQYDIIILDICGVAQDICEDDGIGVLNHLKDRNPLQLVVAYSGQTFDITKSIFFNRADGQLCKPSDFMTCKSIIDSLIEKRFDFEYHWAQLEALIAPRVSAKDIGMLREQMIRALESKNTHALSVFLTRARVTANDVSLVMLWVRCLQGLLGSGVGG